MRGSSEKQVQMTLSLQKIDALESIKVSAEDIENEYSEIAAQTGYEMDKVREQIGESRVTTDIKMRRAARLVADSAIIDNTETEDPGPALPDGDGSDTDDRPTTEE